MSKFLGLLGMLLISTALWAQEPEVLIIDETQNIDRDTLVEVKNEVFENKRFKADGVIGVVGEYIILESDIDKSYIGLLQQNIPIEGISRCELFAKLLEDKLLSHHAVQDSIEVNYNEIMARIDQQLEVAVQQLGSEEKVYTLYNKTSMEEVRKEFFEITKTYQLAESMQQKIYKDVDVTPEEVRQYFFSIPEDERPIVGTELEIAQIVINPQISDEAKRQVIEELNTHRRDVIENGSSFVTKVVLYSDEPSAGTHGGKITLTRKSPFVKEFIDAAFSLQEGEISEPFETEFGYHIVWVEKVRGQERDVRHILKIPKITEKELTEAREKIERIRTAILEGEISFEEAARSESDEKETRNNGGQLVNPLTGDTRFDLTKMEPLMSTQVYHLKNGEISNIFTDESRGGRRSYKILKVTNRIEEHVADFSLDYVKIKELALMQKRIDAVEKWQKEKISETYIHINKDYQDCDFIHNWQKK